MAPPPQKQSSRRLVCGFFRPDGTVASETDVRDAVAAAAASECSKWLAGTILQREDDPSRFGHLVRYWLAGSSGSIRPDRLAAAQQAAIASGIPYDKLLDPALVAAVAKFKAASATADTAIADVYTKWDGIDRAAVVVRATAAQVQGAQAEVKTAQAAVTSATARVKDAEADVKAKTAAQSVLDAAKTDLASARGALTSANTALGTAERERDDAKRKLQDAIRARNAARATRAAAISARNRLQRDAQKIEAPNRKAVRAKIVAAAPSGSVSGLEGAIENALRKAHDFSSDIDAWSAVFVGSCVRAAAIKLKLEGVLAGRHEGKDGLLAMSFRHTEYIAAARGRKKGKQGAYLAFEPKGRVIKKGDIIATDRVEEITMATRITLPRLAGRRNLHCDIVCGVRTDGPQPYAETIGGNVTHTVRRRRYPLTATGELMVSPTDLYLQEDDTGKFGTFSPLPTTPSVLKPRSTGRIFVVLSPVEGCDRVDDSKIQTEVSTRSPWRVPTGEGAFMKRLETLESPFLDGEILPLEPQELDWEATHEASLEEAGSQAFERADDYESESYYDVEPPAREEESTQDYSEDVRSEWQSALLEAEQAEDSYEREEPETLLEREDAELGAADSIDEAAAQSLFPHPVRDRVEPLLAAAAARTASAWNTGRHPQSQRRFNVDTTDASRALHQSPRDRERHPGDGWAEGPIRRCRHPARGGSTPVPAEDLHGVQALSQWPDRRRYARCARLRTPSWRRTQCGGRAERPVSRQGSLQGVSAIATGLSHRSRRVRTARSGCVAKDLVSAVRECAVSRPPFHERHPRRADATAAASREVATRPVPLSGG